MPPVGGKGKGKGSRDHRRSLSRNTTPSSIGASVVQVSTETPTLTAYLDMPLTDIGISNDVTYDEIVERVGNSSGIPDSKNLENLAADLQILSKNAATRTIAYNKGMRELAVRRKHKIEDDTEKERQDREQEQKNEKQRREALAEEEDDEVRGRKINKMKKKKDVSKVREERPLTHGAHGVARQDGAQQDEKGTSDPLLSSVFQIIETIACFRQNSHWWPPCDPIRCIPYCAVLL
jgi:transcriptional adapter 3